MNKLFFYILIIFLYSCKFPLSMKYAPGTILKYNEETGLKRKGLYGIVLGQPNESCVEVLTELKNERMISLFLDKTTSFTYCSIDRIIESYEDMPAHDEKGAFSMERNYLKTVAKLIAESKKTYL
jgi:hypothetical protein